MLFKQVDSNGQKKIRASTCSGDVSYWRITQKEDRVKVQHHSKDRFSASTPLSPWILSVSVAFLVSSSAGSAVPPGRNDRHEGASLWKGREVLCT